MPTKSQLEYQLRELEKRLASEIVDRAIFTTHLGRLAYEHNFKPLLDFLNFAPEELEELKQQCCMTRKKNATLFDLWEKCKTPREFFETIKMVCPKCQATHENLLYIFELMVFCCRKCNHQWKMSMEDAAKYEEALKL